MKKPIIMRRKEKVVNFPSFFIIEKMLSLEIKYNMIYNKIIIGDGMRKRKDKGFTMIELLGVITLLGIIALICIPSISKLLQNVGKSYYDALEQNVEAAGNDYYTDNKDYLPDAVGKTAIVYVGDKTNSKNSLVGLSYIDEVLDRNENTCGYYGENSLGNNKNVNYSYVIVNREYKDASQGETQFRYTSCLSCPGDQYKTSVQENKYCDTSYLPENNKYIKVPKNYYLQISSYDYDNTKLSKVKSDDNQSTYDYFELRKAGVRNNEGEQLVDKNGAITISPNHIDLIIDNKDVGNVDSSSKDAAFNDLVNQLSSKMGNTTFSDYLKSHTIQLKLSYSYTYTLNFEDGTKQDVTRTGETYVTLIKEVLSPAGPVTISSYYQNSSNELYYSATPLDQSIGGTNYSYTYTYNVNHNNVDAKYQGLLSNTISTNRSSYISANSNSMNWINQGIQVNFQAEGSSAFECSYDQEIWYPCESGENYSYTINSDIYVRAISIYGNRGPVNKFPVKIDMDEVVLDMNVDTPTGNNGWYLNNVNIEGKAINTASQIRTTKMCTTTEQSCDPLTDGTNTNSATNFKTVHSEETKKTTYCYKSINNAGSVSNTYCYLVKLDKTDPSCGQGDYIWVRNDKAMTNSEIDNIAWTTKNVIIKPNAYDAISGIDTVESKQFTQNTNTSKISLEIKDKAGRKKTCTYKGNNSDMPIRLDKEQPEIQMLANAPSGWQTSNVTIRARATTGISGIASITKCTTANANCNPNSTISSASGTDTNVTHTASSETKEERVCFKVTANNGLSTTRCSNTWKIDKNAPTCTNWSLSGGLTNNNIASGSSVTIKPSNWATKNVTLSVRCSDSISGCKSQTASRTFSGTQTNTNTSLTIEDNAGHRTTCKANVSLNVDKETPTIRITQNAPSGWQTENFTIRAQATSGPSGIANVTYYYSDATGKNYTAYSSGSSTVTSRSVSAQSNGQTASKRLCFKVTAKNGKTATACSNYWKIDWTAPTITLTAGPAKNAPGCGSAPSVYARYTVSDNLSGVGHVEDYWGSQGEPFSSSFLGNAINRGASTSVLARYGTTCYSSGNPASSGVNYHLKVYARDNAGNERFWYSTQSSQIG